MAKDDYPVGFKKPPKHTQFQPGESGNPAGRPKGTKNLATDVEEELSEKIVITEGGEQKQVSKQRAMLKSLVAKALKGETRAAHVLLNLIVGLEQANASASSDTTILAEEDRAILESYQKSLADNSPSNKPGGSSS